jgi:uncharacterized NAD-dependent epimerase/dehydratase family protein
MDLFIKTLIQPQRGIYLTIKPSLESQQIVLLRGQTLSYDTSYRVDNGLLTKSQPDSNISVEHRPERQVDGGTAQNRQRVPNAAAQLLGEDVTEEEGRQTRGPS